MESNETLFGGNLAFCKVSVKTFRILYATKLTFVGQRLLNSVLYESILPYVCIWTDTMCALKEKNVLID